MTLEHPVFVRWCTSCGREAPEEEYLTCPHCSGSVERYQRVLELPDTTESDAAFAFHSLKAALVEVAGGDNLTAAAAVLSEGGLDPLVARRYPAFASQLASLGVPPRVQQALVKNGFYNFESLCEAVGSLSEANAWAEQLGLPPAAEVLLRRLRHAGAYTHGLQASEHQKRSQADQADNTSEASAHAAEMETTTDAPVKRFRLPGQGAAECMAEELLSPCWQLSGDAQMRVTTDDDSDDDEDACDGQASDRATVEPHMGLLWSWP